MAPKRKPRAPDVFRFGVGDTSLGPVLVALSAKGIVAILVGEAEPALVERLQQHFPNVHLMPGGKEVAAVVKQVVACIEKPSRPFDLPLDMRGSAFEVRVWTMVRKIPVGETSSYTEIARRIGSPRAMRAVGNACSNNKLAFAVPCHRVLRKGGALAGGRFWGCLGQQTLLERESGGAKRKPRTKT